MKKILVPLVVLIVFAVSTHAADVRLPDNMLMVPLIKQRNDNSCSAAVMLSLLKYWNTGYTGTEKDLYESMDVTDRGATPERMVSTARQYGLNAYAKELSTPKDIEQALARGVTVILKLQAVMNEDRGFEQLKYEWDNGHYAVLIGMDGVRYFFMDPSVSAYSYLSKDELIPRWNDFELLPGGGKKAHNRLAIYISGEAHTDARVISPKVVRMQ